MSGYETPAAFRNALTDRLCNLAATSRWTLAQLQRHFAYDRLLERLYFDDERWIVKGAVALLARNLGVRASLDVDVYRDSDLESAEADLRAAATRDIGDWFRFTVGPREAVADDAVGVRFRVAAFVGERAWQEFPIDLVGSDLRMVGEPEHVVALADIAMPGDKAERLPRVSARRSPRRQDLGHG
ncbi:MAG TPA: nucleotidyl transferase AbiEii/AbiGii toxin family protein [Verrucomicrobiae bacterium]|nr:nucleotidyl transferase AbiEii/AbiGii toxin family protein [Verrucomicrobiae bacterium]